MNVYPLLISLRFVAALLPGYVHPDEFFQSPEITSSDVFGTNSTTIPWEFHGDFPCRSIVIPYLNSGLGFLILKLASWITSSAIVNSYTLLVVPRIILAVASLSLDACIVRLSRASGVHESGPLLACASSWPVIILVTRTFSNTTETFLLAVSLSLILQETKSLSVRCASFGALVAFGLFTRFTFLFFAFPLGLYLLHRLLKHDELGWMLVFPDEALRGLFLMFFTFLFVSVPLIVADTMYFATSSKMSMSAIKVTPWNSFSYNMRGENLAKHGLHPRWVHSVVNMPMVFGPLYIALVWRWAWAVGRWAIGAGGMHGRCDDGPRASPRVGGAHRRSRTGRGARRARWVLSGVLVCGLGLLSVAPHQEPRFLLPLLVPMMVLCGNAIVSNGLMMACWIVFNVALGVFFGGLHQGGVVQSIHHLDATLKELSSDGEAPTHLVFYKVFMPPTHLLSGTNMAGLHHRDIGQPDELHASLRALLEDGRSRVFLVCPGYLERADCAPYAKASLMSHHVGPHIDTDHLLDQFHQERFDIGIYRLR